MMIKINPLNMKKDNIRERSHLIIIKNLLKIMINNNSKIMIKIEKNFVNKKIIQIILILIKKNRIKIKNKHNNL